MGNKGKALNYGRPNSPLLFFSVKNLLLSFFYYLSSFNQFMLPTGWKTAMELYRSLKTWCFIWHSRGHLSYWNRANLDGWSLDFFYFLLSFFISFFSSILSFMYQILFFFNYVILCEVLVNGFLENNWSAWVLLYASRVELY